jgi:hypothetical protein
MLRSTPKPPLQTEFLSLLSLTRSSCRRASRPRMSQAPSIDVVLHREASGMLEQPATIRYKPSRRPLLSPQAPSNDAISHRTSDRINASRRGPLQVDETKARRRPLATNKQAASSAVRGQPPARPSHDRVDEAAGATVIVAGGIAAEVGLKRQHLQGGHDVKDAAVAHPRRTGFSPRDQDAEEV